MSRIIRSSDEWKRVRDKIDLVRVAHEVLGEPEVRDGHHYYWFCPFHNGNEPCLQITAGKSRWRCQGCDKFGDAVDIVRHVKELRFSQALAFLSDPGFRHDEEETDSETMVFDNQVISEESSKYDESWLDELLGGAE